MCFGVISLFDSLSSVALTVFILCTTVTDSLNDLFSTIDTNNQANKNVISLSCVTCFFKQPYLSLTNVEAPHNDIHILLCRFYVRPGHLFLTSKSLNTCLN